MVLTNAFAFPPKTKTFVISKQQRLLPIALSILFCRRVLAVLYIGDIIYWTLQS